MGLFFSSDRFTRPGPGVRPELVAGIRRVLALIDDALDQG